MQLDGVAVRLKGSGSVRHDSDTGTGEEGVDETIRETALVSDLEIAASTGLAVEVQRRKKK
jgi:hypothetical protein